MKSSTFTALNFSSEIISLQGVLFYTILYPNGAPVLYPIFKLLSLCLPFIVLKNLFKIVESSLFPEMSKN